MEWLELPCKGSVPRNGPFPLRLKLGTSLSVPSWCSNGLLYVVYTRARVCVHTYVCVYVFMCALFTCVYVCIDLFTHAFVHLWHIYIYIHNICICTHTSQGDSTIAPSTKEATVPKQTALIRTLLLRDLIRDEESHHAT